MKGYYILTVYKTNGAYSYTEVRGSKAAAQRKQRKLAKLPQVKEVTLSEHLLIFI